MHQLAEDAASVFVPILAKAQQSIRFYLIRIKTKPENHPIPLATF